MPVTEPQPHESASRSQGASLEQVLQKAKRTLWAYCGLDLLAWLALCFCGLFGALVLCVAFVGMPFETPLAVWSFFGAASLLALLGVAWKSWRPLSKNLSLAGWIERAALRRGHDLKDSVRSAVELMAEDKSGGIQGRSQYLSKAHQTQTAQAILDTQAMDSLLLVGLAQRWRNLAALGFFFCFYGLMAMSQVSVVLDTWSFLMGDNTNPKSFVRPQVFRIPIVTDIHLKLDYPAYMKKESQDMRGTTGDIVAPLGTIVTFDAQADRRIKEAYVVMGEEKIKFSVEGERQIKGQLQLKRSGNYHFMLVEPDGAVEIDPVGHQIALIPDEPPAVDLLFPTEDMTVEANETVPLQFETSDDYGLKSIRLVARIQSQRGKPWTQVLQEIPGDLRSFSGTGNFSLADVGARPGDQVSLYLEATDNNAFAGPQVGRSITRILTVFSEIKYHKELLKKYEELLWQLVDGLAQGLENPAPTFATMEDLQQEQGVVGQQLRMAADEQELVESMNKLLQASLKDPYDIATLTQALSNAHKDIKRGTQIKKRTLDRIGASHQLSKRGSANVWSLLLSQIRTLVLSFEKHVLFLEDLINTQRLNDAHQLASDLKKTQDALKQLLANYKEAPTDAARDAILNQIERLKEQLQDLYRRMAELKQDVPDEYLNQEAFDNDSMMEQAQSLDSLLEEGKMEDVVATLEDMIEQTQKMLEGIEDSQEEYGGEEYAELKKDLQNFSEQLDDMVSAQSELAQDTEAIYQEALNRAKKEAADKISKTVKRLVEKTKEALSSTNRLPPEALNSLEKEEMGRVTQRLMDLLMALQENYLEEALEEAQGAAQALQNLESSLALRSQNAPMGLEAETRQAAKEARKSNQAVNEVADALGQLIPDLKGSLNKGESQQLGEMAQKQSALNDGVKRLRQMIQKINNQAPLFGEEHQSKLNDASRASRQAGMDLGGQRLKSAREHQRQSQNALESLQESLDEMKNQSGGKGMPMPLPRPGQAQQEGGQEDGKRHEQKRMKLPDADAYQVPEEHRKAILDAMREKAPEDWSKQVREYYEELVK
ncbi:MAG: hypothetical protein CMH56_05670 [Myxococcales bacterium]|nr:hypothetical protein [Myxococcales bacterium]